MLHAMFAATSFPSHKFSMHLRGFFLAVKRQHFTLITTSFHQNFTLSFNTLRSPMVLSQALRTVENFTSSTVSNHKKVSNLEPETDHFASFTALFSLS